MLTDPIADMLTRIRNAVRVERPHVDLPLSKVKRGLAEVLKREGYIWDWEEVPQEPAKQLRLHLKYGPNGERVIRTIRRISKPGRRVYSRSVELKPGAGRTGNLRDQHQPRRDQRSRSAAAEVGRRSALRDLVAEVREPTHEAAALNDASITCPVLEENPYPCLPA